MFVFHVALTGLMLAVILLDLTRYTIPNWLNALVLLLYPAFVLAAPAPVDWLAALAVFGGVFAVGFGVFLLKVIGGGDIKLIIASSPWVGAAALLDFLLAMAILGGVLSLALIMARPLAPGVFPHIPGKPNIPKVLTHGQPIPYGLAIAGAFLWLLWSGLLPGLPV